MTLLKWLNEMVKKQVDRPYLLCSNCEDDWICLICLGRKFIFDRGEGDD